MSSVWHTIQRETAIRNDFMSHGSYVLLITLLAMTIGRATTETTWVLAVIGAVVGLWASLIREAYDEIQHGSWSWYDVLAGTCGTTVAIICMAVLRT